VKSRAQLNKQFDAILYNTLENMKGYSYIDIATVAISLAKVMKQVEFHEQKAAATDCLHQTTWESHPLLFQKVALVAILRCNDFTSQNIANLL
jgi:hypothetical protein